MTACKPIVKWAGGKTKLLPELHKRMPRTFTRYFEPFAGGAALFFSLDLKCPACLSDANADLIVMYRVVRDDVDGVIDALKQHERVHGHEHYYVLRSAWNDCRPPSAVEHAAAFIYLNKTCFNGLWRVNRAGLFNVPIGRYADPPICVPDALRAASRVLSRATIVHDDYQEVVKTARRGSFVYFDPPYDPTSETSSFTSYAGAFGKDDQVALAHHAFMLVRHGVQVMLSNSDTPFIRDLYAGYGVFTIDTVQCPRAINSKGDKRGAVNELIITAGYEP